MTGEFWERQGSLLALLAGRSEYSTNNLVKTDASLRERFEEAEAQ